MLSDYDLSRVWLSLGFVFVTFSGIALKESFCFKVPGLKLVPALAFRGYLRALLQQFGYCLWWVIYSGYHRGLLIGC
ncbi:hypothetical protein P4S64_03275 [Vibrio sp. M60_M31a]